MDFDLKKCRDEFIAGHSLDRLNVNRNEHLFFIKIQRLKPTLTASSGS